MKILTAGTLAIGLTLSFNTMATNALDSLSIESIKQNMTTEQIQSVLDDWKAEQLSLVERKVEAMSDTAPYIERKKYVLLRIDQKYNNLNKALGL
ncbi:hypothetical protein FCV82_07930 [Vibrio breoganii]|uniref:hypothetical protein n=1 Tax=Vibrio breoganii TaxID=553239 RepID=UPI000C8520B6|nr:hypothetical protein [Vibrio breoganii]PMF77465.1 hypothetical protein BCV08_16710 [Vibrio breoganii]TKF88209.1 hypothetical protein FCV82_07930 [Vibrio breoganii]